MDRSGEASNPSIAADKHSCQLEDTHDPSNPQRRKAALALAALPATLARGSGTVTLVKTAVPPPGASFIVEAPKDGVISSVNLHGSSIEEGVVFCEMEDDDEERAVDRINLALQLLELEENLLDPAQVAMRRSILEQGAFAANKNEVLAKQIYDFYDLNDKLSLYPHTDLLSSGISLSRAQAEHAKANASLSLFDFNIAQARKRLNLYKEQIPREQAFLTQRIGRLKIAAPVSGIITIHVGRSSFVSKGHPIATINPISSGSSA